MADLPVVDGDAVKVDFFYNAPAGVQYVPRPAAPAGAGPAPLALRLLPALLPLPARDAAGDGRSNSAVGYGAGLQLRLTGWGGRRAARQRQLAAAAATAGEEGLLPVGQSQAVLPTYLSWVLRNDDNAVLAQGTVPVPTGARGWQHFSTTLKIDAAEDPRRTGHLQVRLCSAGPVPVYLDSLTVRHPRPALFISQEQHYYPFGLGLRGVAANTRPAAAISQAQYNGGSHLEDELVEAGEETSTYATPYRRYDPALGRFQGVDPLADAFADQSPGSFAGNDPANSQDPTGAYTDSNGNSTRGQDNLGIPTSRFKTARSASEGGAAGSMAGSMPYWWGGTNQGMSYALSAADWQAVPLRSMGLLVSTQDYKSATCNSSTGEETNVTYWSESYVSGLSIDVGNSGTSMASDYTRGWMGNGAPPEFFGPTVSDGLALVGLMHTAVEKAVASDFGRAGSYASKRALAAGLGQIKTAGKVLGIVGTAAGAWADAYDKRGFTGGDAVKMAVGLAAAKAGWYGIGFNALDFATQLATQRSISTRVGDGVDGVLDRRGANFSLTLPFHEYIMNLRK